MPLLSRQGGLMLAFPTRVIEDEAFPALTAGDGNMVGPAEVLHDVELFEEEEPSNGAIQVVHTGATCSVTICDFLDAALAYLHEYDVVTCSHLELVPFDINHPGVIPMHLELLGPALEWGQRRAFMEGRGARGPSRCSNNSSKRPVTTAALAEQVPDLAAQMGVLMKQQPAATVGQFPKTHDLAVIQQPRVSSSGFRLPAVSLRLGAPFPPPPTSKVALISLLLQVRTPAPFSYQCQL